MIIIIIYSYAFKVVSKNFFSFLTRSKLITKQERGDSHNIKCIFQSGDKKGEGGERGNFGKGVCVCVCVCARARERERKSGFPFESNIFSSSECIVRLSQGILTKGDGTIRLTSSLGWLVL